MPRRLARLLPLALALCLGARAHAAPASEIRLPAFPLPSLVSDGGPPKNISSVRLMRELQRGGVRGLDRFDAADGDYGLLRSDSLGALAAWLETACKSLDLDLAGARGAHYDGAVFARLLNLATSLASLREDTARVAMPIGVIACRRGEAWGDLPGDGGDDAYVLFATDAGMMVYDPPTRQLDRLADFPNRSRVIRVWF